MKARVTLAACAAGMVILLPTLGAADDTGLAYSLHGTTRIGGKMCVRDHSHFGQSSGHATRAKAEAAAIKAWAEFTAFEYGTDWARYSHAAGKKMNCTRVSGIWDCQLDAIPCRGR